MSIERKSEYYNEIYLNSVEYKKHYEDSIYIRLWAAILPLIPEGVKITELGCGTGQFAQLLFDSGHTNYVGYDFSETAINIAKEINGDFRVQDITDFVFDENDNFFIALEIFEHTKDYKIIENIGLGKEIIFTVPDFADAAHVRYFHSVNEIVLRYTNVIKFDFIMKYKSWFICKGVTI